MLRNNRCHTAVLIGLLIAFLTSCRYFDQSPISSGEGNVLLATVGDDMLYLSDVLPHLHADLSSKDSSDVVHRYRDRWIRRHLMVDVAENTAEINTERIEEKVSQLREELLIHEVQKIVLREALISDIDDAQIRQYYENNPEEFDLKQNIIRGRYLVIPKDAPKIRRVRRWMQSGDEGDLADLNDYSVEYAEKYYLDDSLWWALDELIDNSPFAKRTDQISFLRYNRFVESMDSVNYYFLKVSEYKIKDEIAPLEFHKDRIRSILLARKKKELLNKFEEDIYNKALNDNQFEVID